MPGRVPRSGNCDEAWCDLDRLVSFEDDFGIGLRRQFFAMNETLTSEMSGISIGIGDVILMCQEDLPRSHPRHQTDEPIAVKTWANRSANFRVGVE